MKAIADQKKLGYSDFLTDDAIVNSSNDRADGYDPDDDFM